MSMTRTAFAWEMLPRCSSIHTVTHSLLPAGVRGPIGPHLDTAGSYANKLSPDNGSKAWQ